MSGGKARVPKQVDFKYMILRRVRRETMDNSTTVLIINNILESIYNRQKRSIPQHSRWAIGGTNTSERVTIDPFDGEPCANDKPSTKRGHNIRSQRGSGEVLFPIEKAWPRASPI